MQDTRHTNDNSFKFGEVVVGPLVLPMASKEVVEAVATLVEDDGNAELASAVPIFPPRPDAIMTLLTSDDFLPGVSINGR